MSRARRGEVATSGWTVDTLLAHVQALRAADQIALQLALSERDKALSLAKVDATVVTDHLNQVRTEQNRDRGIFATKETLDARLDALNGRLQSLERWQSKAVGVATVLTLFAGAAGAVITKLVSG